MHQISGNEHESDLEQFLEIVPNANVAIDLKYASIDNFTGKNIYGPFNRAFLHPIAHQKFLIAAKELQRRNDRLKFLVLDALRPRSAQHILWNHVAGTDKEKYVAQPTRGSLHNFGMAIDVTLVGSTGAWLDMGSGFDDFREISQPQLETTFLRSGLLSPTQVANRWLLRECMAVGGFSAIAHEWWHFDALPGTLVRENFTIFE